MRLIKAQVTNYRCVDDSTEFTLDDITCLVGKNEAGKTSLLQALYKLNPHVDGHKGFNKQSDYPRRLLNDFDERHPNGTRAIAIRTWWKLAPDDIAAIEKILGPSSLKSDELIVEAGYWDGSQWILQIDEDVVTNHVLAQASLHTQEVDDAKKLGTVAKIKPWVTNMGAGASERHKKLKELLDAGFVRGDATLAAIDILSKRLPKFIYFSQYDRMRGQVSLDELQKKEAANNITEDERVFLAFLALVGTNTKELAAMNQFEPMIARLEAASIKISSEIFKYWTQNRHLKVQFRLDAGRAGDPAPYNTGNVLRTRVLNQHHDVSVPFDDRSTGFVWFFSFLVLFSQVRKTATA